MCIIFKTPWSITHLSTINLWPAKMYIIIRRKEYNPNGLPSIYGFHSNSCRYFLLHKPKEELDLFVNLLSLLSLQERQITCLSPPLLYCFTVLSLHCVTSPTEPCAVSPPVVTDTKPRNFDCFISFCNTTEQRGSQL